MNNETQAPLSEVKAEPSELPAGWVPLRIAYAPGEDPEDVAFGPQRMMDRLKKWLDRHFAAVTDITPRVDGEPFAWWVEAGSSRSNKLCWYESEAKTAWQEAGGQGSDAYIVPLYRSLAARQASPQQGAAQSEVKGVSLSDRLRTWGAANTRSNCSELFAIADELDRLAASAPTVGGVPFDPAAWLDGLAERQPSEKDARFVRLIAGQMRAATPSSPAVEEASSAGAAGGVWTHPLLAYADGYRAMAKMGDGKVSCWSVVTDIERNMIPATIPAPAPAVPAAGEPDAWLYEAREGDMNPIVTRRRMAAYPEGYRGEMWAEHPLYRRRPSAAVADEGKDAAPINEKLLALADRIDHEKLWARAGLERRDWTQEQHDRCDAGVELRRYAGLLGQDRWRIFTPHGPVRFSATTLDAAYEMAKNDEEHRAARAGGETS